MMRKVSLILSTLFLIFGPVLIEACTTASPCECCDRPRYSIADIYLTTSLAGATPPTSTPHSAVPKNLRFEFMVGVQGLSSNNEHNGYRPTMAAYADCVALPSNTVSKEAFTSLSVTSTTTLVTKDGRSFKPGDNMATLFLQNGIVVGSTLSGQTFNFTPIFSVGQKASYQLKFSFALDDGRKFDLLAGPLELLPD